MAEQAVRTDLSDLVRNRRIELGIGGRALQKRCIDPATGEPPFGHEWLRKLEAADPSVKTPRLHYLQALAVGLQLPLSVLQTAAAAQYMGIQPADDAIWSKDHSARLVVARMSELSPEDRAQLAEMVELFTRGKLPPPSESDRQ